MAPQLAPSLDLQKVLELATLFRKIAARKLHIDYDREADVLYISFEKPQEATNSIMREDGIIVHYRGRKPVGVTITDASDR